MDDGLKESSYRHRKALLDIQHQVRTLVNHPDTEGGDEPSPGANRSEAKANLMLAVRHIEDARMRLGKVVQAMDGGTSVYDK
jgi:hypothetical protein